MKLYVIAATLGATVAACTASGFGSGQLTPPLTTTAAQVEVGASQGPVVFYWKSDGASWERGTIRADLPRGRTFTGEYLEPSSVSEGYSTSFGFGCGWYGWCFGGPSLGSTSVTTYSGYLLAWLDDGRGTRMNCRFVLADPPSGPKNGGRGTCDLSTGERITDVELHGE